MVDIGHVLSRVTTDLTGIVATGDTDFPVVSTSGFVAPCAILIGHKDAWHDPTVTYVPEIAWCTEVVDGTTLRCLLPDRGISGTAVRSHDGTTGDLTVTQVFDQRNWEGLRTELDARVTKVGDTMTGLLTLPSVAPNAELLSSHGPNQVPSGLAIRGGATSDGWPVSGLVVSARSVVEPLYVAQIMFSVTAAAIRWRSGNASNTTWSQGWHSL